MLTSADGKGPLFKTKESRESFDDNVYLHAAVQKYVSELARTKFQLARRNAKGETTYIEKHVALETFRRPQASASGKSLMSGMDLLMITGMHILLNGEAFWVLDKRLKVNGAPTFVQPLLPDYMNVKTDGNGELSEYVYRLPQKEMRFDPQDIVHFKFPDPSDMMRGNSPLKALRWAIDTHKEADELNSNRIQNNAVPAGIITTEGTINEDQQRKYLQQWKSMYGGTKNASKVAMMPKGLDFKEVQQSNAEMQYVQGKAMNRDEILAMYSVGLEMLGRTESQTRANADTAVYVFARFGFLPFLEKFVDTLNNDYLTAFPGTDGMEFTFADPVPENLEEKRLNAQTLFGLGGMTPNELRKNFGLEELNQPGMDLTYLDMGKVPVNESPPDFSLAA